MKPRTFLIGFFLLFFVSTGAAADEEAGKETMEKAYSALKATNWSEALKLFNQVVKETKGSDEAMWGKGLVYIRKGDYKAAKGYCRSFIKKNKKSPYAHACLGYAQLVWKRSSLAIQAFEDALAVDPDFALAVAGVAHARLLQARYKEAEEKFREALEKDPEELEALLGLADLLLLKNRKKEALELLSGVEASFPDSPRFLLMLARLKEKGEDAEHAAVKALSIRPDWAEAHEILARIHFRNKKFEQCTVSGRKAIELDPNLVDARKFLGICQYKLEHYDEAVAALSELLEKVPNMAYAQYYIGLAHDARNEYDEAEEAYKSAMNMDVKFAAPVVSLGYLYYRTGKPTSATSTMEKALELQPGNSLAHQVLGDIHFERSSFAKAKQYYEKALSGNMKDVDREYLEKQLKKSEENL